MAFDQATRNRLQKFVGDARKLLSEEFTQQLQNTYGLDPVTGDIATLNDLPALSPTEQQTAKLLRDTLEHYLAASHKVDPHKDKALVIVTLDRIVREQAFTVLNRLAALRMAEARQFVMESISQGYQSKGFQLYQRISASSLGETGQAYQYYLFSVFDELSLDLAVLFDRYSSQGRLFPRETILLELLDLINHAELELLWGEDETIGWIYQYFNSKEERKKMRDESQAPRNSRELAVRNQFFTPRYVVEYLTDNTLGQIWYEMTKGKTTLVDSCHYLVRRSNEVFLKKGEFAPAIDSQDLSGLTHEELNQKSVYVYHRPIKDPRDIKMLDPACGSMHFGLYAFDLFVQIYSEAWDIEEKEGKDFFWCEDGMPRKPALQEVYSTKSDFLADVPRLIIENNIYGVDIDPRAAQIAGLSLWLRAQKTWSDNSIKANERPQIQRSNIVCAESMPGEKELLKDFTSQIQPRVLGQLVEEVFDKMHLAGEAGALLKIEKEIQGAIDEAKSQKDENTLEVQGGLFGENKWEVREGKRYYNFGDVSEDFWGQAEQLILSQLELYAESATDNISGQRRMFATDAAKGFAFIDLCRNEFDLILMNPPFGECSKRAKSLINKVYPISKNDIYGCFITRAKDLLRARGFLGAITSRTGFSLSTFEALRKDILNHWQINSYVDLGDNVLDAAMVKTSTYVFQNNSALNSSVFIDLNTENDKGSSLLEEINGNFPSARILHQSLFNSIPGSPFSYWVDQKFLEKIISLDQLESDKNEREVRQGMATSDDFRFIRLVWEVPPESIGVTSHWVYFAKGGESTPYYSDIHLVVNWKDSGKEIKQYAADRWGSATRTIKSIDRYFVEGLTYTSYTNIGFRPRVLPKGCVFSVAGMHIYLDSSDPWFVLGVLNSSYASYFLGLITDGRKFEAGYVKKIPIPANVDKGLEREISDLSRKMYDAMKLVYDYDETSRGYYKPPEFSSSNVMPNDFEGLLNNCVWKALGYSGQPDFVEDSKKSYIETWSEIYDSYSDKPNDLSWAVGVAFGRFDIKAAGNDGEQFKPKPFDEIPNRQPGALNDSPPYNHNNGILVSDFGGDNELPALVESIINEVGGSYTVDIKKWLDKEFFPFHLKMYTKSRRQAPIYWPIQVKDSSYTLWIYYHSINDQTLFSCVNDYIDPKNESIQKNLDVLMSKNNKSNEDQVHIESLVSLGEGLRNLREEILKIAEFWKPSLEDGVEISAAPLWPLIQYKPWRKRLKKTWDDMQKGKYDWSHMAFCFWPERVVASCCEDHSLAIAHNLESELWEEVELAGARGRGVKKVWQPKEMTEAELNELIKNKIAKG